MDRNDPIRTVIVRIQFGTTASWHVRDCNAQEVIAKETPMRLTVVLLQLLLSGFFALACMRSRAGSSVWAWLPRLERYRRAKLQWASFIVVLLMARIQGQLPPAVEALAAVEFLVFWLLPTQRSVHA